MGIVDARWSGMWGGRGGVGVREPRPQAEALRPRLFRTMLSARAHAESGIRLGAAGAGALTLPPCSAIIPNIRAASGQSAQAQFVAERKRGRSGAVLTASHRRPRFSHLYNSSCVRSVDDGEHG